MKYLSLLAFACCLHAEAQYIDGPANLRQHPKGDIIASVGDFRDVEILESSSDSSWFKIALHGYILQNSLEEGSTVSDGATLVNYVGDTICLFTRSRVPVQVYSNSKRINNRTYKSVKIEGWTYKDNIRFSVQLSELLKNRQSFSDICENSFSVFRTDYGYDQIHRRECLYSLIETRSAQENYPLVARIVKNSIDSGGEKPESNLTIDMFENFSPSSHTATLKVQGDEVETKSDMLVIVDKGCCDSPDLFTAYKLPDLEKVFEYESHALTCTIPKSSTTGTIAFMRSAWGNKETIGSLFLVVNSMVVNEVIFMAAEEQVEQYKMFPVDLWLDPIYSEDRLSDDKRHITLHHQTSLTEKLISGFRIHLEFFNDDTGNTTIEVEVKDGQIAGKAGRFGMVIK